MSCNSLSVKRCCSICVLISFTSIGVPSYLSVYCLYWSKPNTPWLRRNLRTARLGFLLTWLKYSSSWSGCLCRVFNVSGVVVDTSSCWCGRSWCGCSWGSRCCLVAVLDLCWILLERSLSCSVFLRFLLWTVVCSLLTSRWRLLFSDRSSIDLTADRRCLYSLWVCNLPERRCSAVIRLLDFTVSELSHFGESVVNLLSHQDIIAFALITNNELICIHVKLYWGDIVSMSPCLTVALPPCDSVPMSHCSSVT